MKEKHFTAWQESRKLGFLSYVLRYGVIACGVPLFVVMTFFFERPYPIEVTFRNIILNFGAWALCGAIFSALLWFIFEPRYQRELSKRNKKNHS